MEVPRACYEPLIKAGAFDFLGADRGAVLAALDVAMAESARAAADRKSGQGALFGGAPVAQTATRAASDGFDASKAWSRAETLRAEREVLGFYLSGHPLEERAGLFAVLSTVKTTELAERSTGTEITLAGLLVQVATTIVKSGKLAGQKMARLRIEDLEGGVNVTCFPRTFEQFKAKLVDDAVVVIRGKVEERAEERSLILDEVWTVDEALRRFDGGLVVRLEPQDHDLLVPLRDTLRKHPGRRPVYLQVRGGDEQTRRVRCGSDLRVDISPALAEQVDKLLGRGRVRLARM
jgi:DNA polymerase-3 subunit alpha